MKTESKCDDAHLHNAGKCGCELSYANLRKPMQISTQATEIWEDQYPLNTFSGETKRELIEMICNIAKGAESAMLDKALEKLKKLTQDPDRIRNKAMENQYNWDEATRIGSFAFSYNSAVDDAIEALESLKPSSNGAP